MPTNLILPTVKTTGDIWGQDFNNSIVAIRDRADAAHVLTPLIITGDYTLSDSTPDVVEGDSESLITVTVPPGLDHRAIEIYQKGNGQIQLVEAPGVAIRKAPGTTGLRTPGRYGSILLRSRGGQAVSAPPSGSAFRFRADDLSGSNGSSVTSWADSSGNGLPAAVGTNTTLDINSGGTGHKGVAFNGSSSYMTLSGSALNIARNRGALTVFAAIALPNAVTTGTRTIFALSTGSSGTASRVLLGHRDSVSGLPIAGGRQLDGNSLVSVTGTALTTVQNVALTARFIWSSSDLYLYQNGTLAGSTLSFQANGNTSDTASMTGIIGANLSNNGEWFSGRIMELIGYTDADLTGSIRAQVHTYFQQTYGITVSDALPAAEWVSAGGIA